MSKQLYEDALADVRSVKALAEDNAKRAILEAVTPRIREFIDKTLLDENSIDDMEPEVGGEGDEVVTDINVGDPNLAVPLTNPGPAGAITPPGPDGKVSLDLDALCVEPCGAPVPPPLFGKVDVVEPEGPIGPGVDDDVEYELSNESIDALRALSDRRSLSQRLKDIGSQADLLLRASRVVRESRGYREQLTRLISRVEDTYDHVQEQVTDPARKVSVEDSLEATYKALNRLQEQMTMSQKTKKNRIDEADLTLKLTGLPDDVEENLDSVSVELITGEDDGDEPGSEDAGGDDFDFGGGDDGDDQGQGQQAKQTESRRLSDDTIVEIDEGMLRREIARMRGARLNEERTANGGPETKADSWGNGSGDADILDDFGGGHDMGDARDQDVVDRTKSSSPLGEADGSMDMDESDDDQDQMMGQDEMMGETDDAWANQAVDPNGKGGDNDQPTNKQARTPGDSFAVTRQEGLKRLGYENKLQERACSRAASLKRESARCRARGDVRRFNAIKREYTKVARQFNESVARSKKFKQIVVEATQGLQRSRHNGGDRRSAVGADESLRKKLAETNLFNAKLLYTNKLLQLEQLTARQKAQVIKQLDGAQTIREVKLVYESLTSTLSGSKSLSEGTNRSVLGSGSRPTRPASTQTLNEGHEAERWAQLAGITKR